jgi:hypothetical protein
MEDAKRPGRELYALLTGSGHETRPESLFMNSARCGFATEPFSSTQPCGLPIHSGHGLSISADFQG